MTKPCKVSDLNNLVVSHIDVVDNVADDSDKIVITTECGRRFIFAHHQDCCEMVQIYDTKGDLKTLEGKKLISVEMYYLNDEDPEDIDEPSSKDYSPESFTWTIITFKTTEDTVISRWIGTSNGYYSEDVDFEELT